MEEIHTHSEPSHRSRLNILPILVIAGLIYVLFWVDLDSFINSPQFQKNISYIKTSFQKLVPKANIDTASLFSTFSMPKLPDLSTPVLPNQIPRDEVEQGGILPEGEVRTN